MRGWMRTGILCGALGLSGALLPCNAAAQTLGLFTQGSDVGTPSTIGPGSSQYDASTKSYTVTGGGENMWAAADHFHYLWKKVSGDVLLEASVEFVDSRPAGSPPEGHRKACLVIRQSLDSNAVYVDAARHGDGLTSLQWRDTAGAATHEVQSSAVGPTRLRIERRGNYVSMSIAGPGEELRPSGGAARIDLNGEFYVGLGVTSHNVGRLESVKFSDVKLGVPPALTGTTTLVNTLETINLKSKDRRAVYVVTQPQRIEAPNWFPDATNTLYFNNGGKLFKIQADPPGAPRNPNRLAAPEPVDLGMLTRINNDHGVTADGKSWAISDQSQTVNGQRSSLIYVVPVGGTDARRVTDRGPSYFHGWSPDGKTLAYCARAGWQLRRVHGFRRRWGGDETDHCHRQRRRSGILARREIHLLQLGTNRRDADLADEGRRYGAGAGHDGRRRELVPARLAGWDVAGVPDLREGRWRSPREQGRPTPSDEPADEERGRAGEAVRRTGHDQRGVVVPEQPVSGVRELSDRAAVAARKKKGGTLWAPPFLFSSL